MENWGGDAAAVRYDHKFKEKPFNHSEYVGKAAEWCRANCKHRWRKTPWKYQFEFEDREEALLFKLVWT